MADTTIGTSVAIATPDLEIIEGQITTTSQQIAEHFGKRHTHVLRAIRNLLAELPESARPNFGLSEFTDDTGRKLPAYRITRDGFTLLAMGFTGKEAMQWKVAYLTAFNKMEQELLARTSYTVQPSDTLNESQQIALRALLESNVKRLPQDKQAGAMVKGWSKLKAHFGVPYRQIPASEFTEAISIVARHVSEWELVDDNTPKAGTVNETVADLVKKIEAPNGYPAVLFTPIVEAVQRKMGNQPAQPDAARTKAAFDAASQAAASVQSAVFNAVLSGNDEWKYSRWMLAFIDDTAKGSPAYVRQLDHGSFVTTWPRLVRDVANGECMCTSAELIEMAAACMQRLQQRPTTARIAA
jgi:Rha family phage regulatory protein